MKGNAWNAKTPLECWECLFDTQTLELLIKYINQYFESVKSKFSLERGAKETDVIEIKAVIGLLYLAAAYRGNCQSLEEI